MGSLPDPTDDFELFGLAAESASPDALKAAFYELALLCHPSRGGSDEQMHAVVEAYERVLLVLVPSEPRNAVRRRLNRQSPPDPPDPPVAAAARWSLPGFMDIFEETHAQFNSHFNTMFESQQQTIPTPSQINAAPQPSNAEGKGLLSTFGCPP
jgi:hypothetical protein